MMIRARGASERRSGERPGPLLRLSGGGRVWLLTVGLALVSLSVYLLWVRRLPSLAAPISIPWWGLAAGFALVELFVVHIEVRREAHSFSLSDIPLVMGLFFVDPSGFVLAQLVGAALALAVRRQAPVKLVFNLTHFVLEAQVALLVFHALAGGDPLGTMGIAAAFLAVLLTSFIGAGAITAAISLAEGRAQLETLVQGLGFGSVIAGANTCVALLAVEVLWRVPSLLWLFIAPGTILFFAYRTYTVQRERHRVLESLYEFTRRLHRSLRVEPTVHAVLSEARVMFRAEVASVTLFPGPGESEATHMTLGPGDGPVHTEQMMLDPTEGVWARVASEDLAVLLARPIQSSRLQAHYAARGIRDAMVAPLRGSEGTIGVVLVGNRMSDVSTFGPEDLQLFETLANHASVSLENVRLVERLEESLAHLKEMNRLKDDFVATVSHELRTPLTSIQGSIKTMLRLDLGAQDQRDMLEAADRGSDRLRHLIEDLLMASRIEAREIHAELEPVSLADVIDEVVAQVDVGSRGHGLHVDLEDGVRALHTDEGKMVQILSNLVDNAVKYSPEGTPVVISARSEADGTVVSVTNGGPAIPEEARDRVFDRFYQVDQSSTRVVGGAGLGLYICRTLAEAIGGRVWLERSDDEATTFSLFVPTKGKAIVPVLPSPSVSG